MCIGKCYFKIYLTARHFLYFPLAASPGVTARAQEARITTMMQKRMILKKMSFLVFMGQICLVNLMLPQI